MIKRLLLISGLILSSSLWADKITFSCEEQLKNKFKEARIIDLSIDTKKKTVQSGSKTHNYQEKGDEIIFSVGFGRFVMNRMTGILRAQERSNSLVWMTVGTLKCKKAEKLF